LKTKYKGREKRKYPRLDAHFFVSYTLLDQNKILDIGQAKNISIGGALITTDRYFEPETKLFLKMRIPPRLKPISFIGRVIESRKIAKGLIYETRIEILALNPEDEALFKEILDLYLKEKEKR
jgi:hypothetical protein